MKIIFMGTPAFAVPSLEILFSHHEVCAVLTQPDRPAGRGQKLQISPVKAVALEKKIPVLQPETLHISNKFIRAELKNFCADIFVVAAYGLLLPKGVLTIPPHGCINVHASLLPKYRGASPIHSAILNGDNETGITIMQMDNGLDTGEIILQRALKITRNEYFSSLHDRMAQLGGEILLEALTAIENGTVTRIAQNDALSSYAPLIKKSDAQINWADSSEKIANKIRAFTPAPGCFTFLNGEVLKIFACEKIFETCNSSRHDTIHSRENNLQLDAVPSQKDNSQSTETIPSREKNSSPPGTILSREKNGLAVKTGDGALVITELQALGKKRMSAADFLRGQKSPLPTMLPS